ncbi:MAG: MXAN_5808 family serine peptidase [bacterium]
MPERLSTRSASPSRLVGMLLITMTFSASCTKRSTGSSGQNNRLAELQGGMLVAGQSGGGGPIRLLPGSSAAHPLKVLSAAISTIDEKYVAPSRINPAKMFDKAIEFVEAERAELRITGSARKREVLVRVADRSQRFALGPLTSVSMLYTQLKQILGYIRKSLRERGPVQAKELAQLEYAAVNGIVSTLDPHSVLMPPKIYGEMQIRTRGAFGGIGIVISIRDGALTVISPIDDTPAARAGIRAGDRIVKIEDESTVNMPLSEAVSHLRGKPGSSVAFWVEREGWHEARRFDIVRSRIEIKSVTSRQLPGNVGYVRINRFSHNTTDELKTHLRKLKAAKVRGIVLDMWNNPGGLLQQAEMVADAFLSEGDIVITEAARGVVLRVRKASSDTTVFTRPVVVLVNRGSASAAEIVAGALKNHGRALVLGETTFGKGTVQMLFDNNDGSALKLTVAQYLTPGSISIQTVGVSPDIETNSIMLAKTWTRMFGHEVDARRRAKREDLLPARSPQAHQPAVQLDYLNPESTVKPDADQTRVSANAAEAPVVELARMLLVRHAGTRAEMLRGNTTYLAEWGRQQEKSILRALAARNVDWRAPSPSAAQVTRAQLTVSVAPSHAKPVLAGATTSLRVTVTNRSPDPVFRLRGRTDAPSYYLHERELILGLLKPGETRTVELPVKIPMHTRTSIQPVKVMLQAANLAGVVTKRSRIAVRGIPRPSFRLTYRLHDDVQGNGDGRPEPGETIRLRITVQNDGPGALGKGVVALRNLAGRGINILKGRFGLKQLASGSKKDLDLTFRIEPTYDKRTIKLELSVYDSQLHASLQGHLALPLKPKTATAPGLVGEISPPRITLHSVPLEVPKGTDYLQLSGTVTDDARVQDLYVEVTNYDAAQVRHKAYYLASPQGATTRQLPFAARVPLWPGLNTILVVARENGEVMGFERLLVLKP